MTGTLHLAWRYLVYHRLKTSILLASITLILYLPVGLRVLVEQSARQLTARAEATPLVVGAKGSPLELILSTLYFGNETPDAVHYGDALRVEETGLALAIPIHARFNARGRPIVGTMPDGYHAGRVLCRAGSMTEGSRSIAGSFILQFYILR